MGDHVVVVKTSCIIHREESPMLFNKGSDNGENDIVVFPRLYNVFCRKNIYIQQTESSFQKSNSSH